MKTVGNQLQEARQAKNWTPELAARETKIRVDRLRDLEADDYTHFSSPAYARGFVRTYARALGLDEYKILRQLDNKLPEDDNASFVNESGLPYIPEASKLPRGTSRSTGSNIGLYVVMLLGCGVFLIISFVLFQAYRAGELQRYFAKTSPGTATTPAAANTASTPAASETTARALPVDSNTPPPIVETTTNSVKALPVENAASTTDAVTNAPPVTATSDTSPQSVKALPVDTTDSANTGGMSTNASTTETVAPRAQAVDPNDLTNAPTAAPTPPPAPPPPISSVSARASGSSHIALPTPRPPTPDPASTTATSGKRLILSATRDSFVRVTALDAPDLERSLYASVLHAGQSISFDGHKFSVNVGIPSAVNVSLDGVNYGPHSDQEAPETFTVESHQP